MEKNETEEKTPILTDKEVIKTKKENIKKSIKETVEKLKGICNDAKFADVLIDKLLSLKGQLDVEATLVNIPVESIIEEFDYGSFQLIRTEQGILFKMAGMRQLVTPVMQTLYGQLDYLLENKKMYITFDEETKKVYDYLFSATMAILKAPTICFIEDGYWNELALFITQKQNQLFDRLLGEELKPEDEVANAMFNRDVEFKEKLKEEAKEYEKEVNDELQ